MLGINSRDLNTFKINKNYAADVISRLDKDKLIVAESGIDGAGDVAFLGKLERMPF